MLRTVTRGRLRIHTQSTLARSNDIIIFGRLLDTPTSPLNDPTSQGSPFVQVRHRQLLPVLRSHALVLLTRRYLLHMKFVKG